MLRHPKSLSAIAVLVAVGACAPKEVGPITADPLYNKFGEPAGCADGYTYSTFDERCYPPNTEIPRDPDDPQTPRGTTNTTTP